ncbi:lytic murein transglycosylase [Halorhodospira halophila]|uniref:lytic murein transglycosylase n=1 Tax=Halorhodospira halophila TaxID=1053 RepID=UPI001912E306|nr:lytic murein transglycosylase [Halorhodospira halophila]MBK5937259.1 lytic transglycosylase [Halorhodospira halophila]
MPRPPRWPMLMAVCLTAPVLADDFEQCVTNLRADLKEQGRDAAVVEETFADVEQLERILELDREQPEFVQTFREYLDARLTDQRIDRGEAMMDEHRELLWRIHADFGVPPRYLVALWGMETHYGSYFGEVPIIDAMTTLACEGRRARFFFHQLDATLALLEDGKLARDGLRGSWAGALGHTQFMPTTLREHAVDYDGSGRIDLRDSVADALASGANYLRSMGWRPGLRWGREVSLADGFGFEHLGLDDPQPLDEWQQLGVRRADGSDLPESDIPAALLLPMGRNGPAFLVYENFRRIMGWNASVSYALSVGLLADRLDGAPPLRADFPDEPPPRHNELRQIQEVLNELGFDAGPVDGLLGPQTRAALRAYQQDRGLPADGYPDQAIRDRLLEKAD